MTDCIFCKIISGEIPTKFIAKHDNVVAFYDVNPKAATHILILPTQHIPTFLDIKIAQNETIMKMIETAQELISKYKLEAAYRMVFNGGRYQHVPHLHWHLLADKPTTL